MSIDRSWTSVFCHFHTDSVGAQVAQLKKAKQKAAGDKEKKPAKKVTSDEAAKVEEEALEDADSKPTEEPEDAAPEEEADSKEPVVDSIPEDEAAEPGASRPGHGRQASLSIQSKLRSSSFRRTSNGPASPAAGLKSPPLDLPPMTPDSSTITDIYRKQAARLEELERDNKRLEKEASDGEARWRKSEEELEELREASTEAVTLRDKAKKGEDAQREIEKLKAEISSLQRQHRSASITSRPLRSPSIAGLDMSTSPDADTKALLSSKDATITDMELEISNLRTQITSQTSSCTTHGSQITALADKLSAAESKVRDLNSELADAKKSLTRASEKAVKEGVEKTSTDTKIRNLERELADAKQIGEDVTKKAETLEKKLEAMNKLHRESEARMQSKLVTAEKEARDLVALKKKLVTLENENSRLKDERERRKRKEATGGDDAGLDELEDEERQKLEQRIRDLEGENFDLRRGVWRDRRKELQETSDEMGEGTGSSARNGVDEDFDEVDLSGGRPLRRQSLARTSSGAKHSSFTTVLSSGLAAFRSSQPAQHSALLEDDDLLDDDAGFDENAFASAQREEEMRKMVEHVREVKRKLKDWQGWRLDLVDGRRSLGWNQGYGEIFEV